MLPAALVSLMFYAYVIVLCRVAVRMLTTATDETSSKLMKTLGKDVIVEFFGCLQVCACVFENGAFLHFYGYPAYFIALTTMAFIHSQTIEGAYANPAILIEDAVRGKRDPQRAGWLLVAELVAGAVSCLLCRAFWALGMHEEHARRFGTYACNTDLHVPILVGILCEFLASALAQFADLAFAKRLNPREMTAASGATCALITCCGLTLTGMYYNPILASALTFGCDGLDSIGHVEVYWLGPIVGQFVGTEVHRILDGSVDTSSKKAA